MHRDGRPAQSSRCWPRCLRRKGTCIQTLWSRRAHLSREIPPRKRCGDLLGRSAHCCSQQLHRKGKRNGIALLQLALALAAVAPPLPSAGHLHAEPCKSVLAWHVLHLCAFARHRSFPLLALAPLSSSAPTVFWALLRRVQLCISLLGFLVLPLSAFARFPPLLRL